MSTVVVIAMRRANMRRVHHRMIELVCDRCREPVGVYPSGQAVLKSHPSIELVCEVCYGPITGATLAPGAAGEVAESVPDNPPAHFNGG